MNSIRERLTAFLIIFLILFFLLISSGSLFSGSHFRDDHVIVAMHQHFQFHSFGETMLNAVKDEFLGIPGVFSGNRFRPLFVIHAYTAIKVFGVNFFAWHLYVAVVTGFTTYFLYVFARLIRFNFAESLAFALFTTIGPQLDNGFRLLNNETIGMFFLALALVFAAKANFISPKQRIYEFCFVASSILMSLSKESFILFVPAILFLKTWHYRLLRTKTWKSSLHANLFLILFLLTWIILEILYVKFAIGTSAGYAGVSDVQIENIAVALVSLSKTTFPLLLGLGCILGIFVTIQKRYDFARNLLGKILNTLFSPYSFLFALIVLPQVYLYAQSGFWARYLVPALIGYSFVLISLYKFINRHSKPFGIIMSLCLLLGFSHRFNQAWQAAYIDASEGKKASQVIQFVGRHTQSEDPILIVSNPYFLSEWTGSIRNYLLGLEGRSNLYLATYGSQKTDYFTDAFLEQEKGWFFLDPEGLNLAYGKKNLSNLSEPIAIQCIVVPAQLHAVFLSRPPDGLDLKNYISYVYPSVDRSVDFWNALTKPGKLADQTLRPLRSDPDQAMSYFVYLRE